MKWNGKRNAFLNKLKENQVTASLPSIKKSYKKTDLSKDISISSNSKATSDTKKGGTSQSTTTMSAEDRGKLAKVLEEAWKYLKKCDTQKVIASPVSIF